MKKSAMVAGLVVIWITTIFTGLAVAQQSPANDTAAKPVIDQGNETGSPPERAEIPARPPRGMNAGKSGGVKAPAGAQFSPEMLKELEAAMAASRQGGEENQGAGEIDLSTLKAKYQNAVVKIEFTAIENNEETKMNPTKSELYYAADEPPHGTGFFINDTDVLTNAHVVEEARSGSIRVKSPATGGVEFKADVIGVGGSETIDLAVLRLPADEILRFKKRSGLDTIPHLTFGDSDKVHQADALGIFGYPQSSDELKMIQAKVTGRQYLKLKGGRFVCGHQFIEVGPGGVVQPGNSGGPALNKEGQVVGVPSRGSGYAMEQAWIIPSDIVVHFLDRVKQSDSGKKSLRLPMLGLSLTNDFAGTAVWTGAPEDCVIFELGVVVREVIPGSLGEEWGLKKGDILVGFANKEKEISCALDFEGYRVTTGKMRVWPQGSNPTTVTLEGERSKLHLSEMILCSDEGDDITLWYVRKGEKGIQTLKKKMEYKQPVAIPHLGTFLKPQFELWGDFVAQDFNSLNARLFEVPTAQIQKGGALVTFVEPNSLASRRGMEPQFRPTFGFAFMMDAAPRTTWIIIETVNDKPVKNLAELKAALREAEKQLEEKKKAKDYDPARRILMKENYVQIGFRTNNTEGNILHLEPAFPIDEALECRKNVNLNVGGTGEGK